MIDINERRKRGYGDESIALMLREEFEKNFIPEPHDYDEDPSGWVDYYSGYAGDDEM